MATPFRPRFVVTLTSPQHDFTATYPHRPWRFSAPTIGAQRWSASQVPASYRIGSPMRDLGVSLIITEAERPTFQTLLEAVSAPMTAFTFHPDAGGTVTADTFSVWLLAPAAGGDFGSIFVRREEYLGVFDVEVVLRLTDPTGDWNLIWQVVA